MAAILFVDDEPAIREMLGTVLKLAGHLPLDAADAEEARSVLRSHGADLALVDLDWEREITPELFGDSDFSVYEGIKLKGWPRYTISRGEIIQKDGVITAEPGRGKYLKRHVER